MSDLKDVSVESDHDRYHRQTLISWWDQDVLAGAKVIVVGAGALGNELVKNLALVGIGQITLVDLDRIENSNLSRCVFFRREDEGEFKADVLARRAMEMNPEIVVTPVVGDVRLTLGLGAFKDADLVLGGLDNREARMYVNQACWKTSTPWVDGAIEGLMGVARVFVPPHTACYECTMTERDHELISQRRACSLLSMDEMLEGKVPTTATSSSVIAGIQVQEAVKLLHRDRLGEPELAGAGYCFVGLTHDSYVVRYQRNEDCFAHDTYDMNNLRPISADTTFGEVLDLVADELGSNALVDLEHDILLSVTCESCDETRQVNQPMDALTEGEGACPSCSEEMRLEMTHTVTRESPLLEMCPEDLGLPAEDVLAVRGGEDGMQRLFFLTGQAVAA